MRTRIRRLLLGLVVFSLVTVGCGATASPSEVATPTPGSTPTATPSPTPTPTATPKPSPTPGPAAGDATMHVEFPSDWQEIEMTEEAIRAQIDAFGEKEPVMVAMLQQFLDSTAFEGIGVFAYGFDGATIIGNLVGLDLPIGDMTLDAARPIFEAQFKQLGGSGLTWSERELAIGPVTVLDMSLDMDAPTGTMSLTDRIFFYVSDGTLYELTFTCMEAERDLCLADADAIAATWSITD